MFWKVFLLLVVITMISHPVSAVFMFSKNNEIEQLPNNETRLVSRNEGNSPPYNYGSSQKLFGNLATLPNFTRETWSGSPVSRLEERLPESEVLLTKLRRLKRNENKFQFSVLMNENRNEEMVEQFEFLDENEDGQDTVDYKSDDSTIKEYNESVSNSIGETVANFSELSDDVLCRSWETDLPKNLYLLDVTAWCYLYTAKDTQKMGGETLWRIVPEMYPGTNYSVMQLQHPTNSSLVEWADYSSDSLLSSLLTNGDRMRWRDCNEAARKCCVRMTNQPQVSGTSPTCPRTWDRLQCWEDTSPGTVSEEQCPEYMNVHIPCSVNDDSAYKVCGASGHWFRNGGHEWTDFRRCNPMIKVYEHIISSLKWHVAVCVLSIVALVPALVIFFSFRQLQVRRITLHKHLFLSLLLEALCTISLRGIQLSDQGLIQQNPWWCLVLSIFLKYFRQTNYMWFFNEGFYLHRLLASAFSEQRNFFLFYCCGWVVPMVPVLCYVVVRVVSYGPVTSCLILPEEDLEWLLMIVPLAAILANFLFLINIIRILVIKLQATDISQFQTDISQYRKMVRATFMMVPLFGLQFLLTIYRPPRTMCLWVNAYYIMNHLIEGSTGVMVAVIFCYMNSEVKTLLGKKCNCLPSDWRSRFTWMLPNSSANQKTRYSMSTTHTILPADSKRGTGENSPMEGNSVALLSGEMKRKDKTGAVMETALIENQN